MAASTVAGQATGSVLLDIGDGVGALVVLAGAALEGREIEVSPEDNAARRTHTEVLRRVLGRETMFAAVFAGLAAGSYSLWRDVLTDVPVRIREAEVTEVDWRSVTEFDDFRLALAEATTARRAVPDGASRHLPARYRTDQPVCAQPMGSAPMLFGDGGHVAWDQMWTTYCDLALAGGPSHRQKILDAPDPVHLDPESPEYLSAVAEIERGFRLVTGMATARSGRPGWVGLCCASEMMARWMVSAIAAENVAVRREGATIFLPASGSFSLEKEIKNVVTVVAKTHHYWSEHSAES